jgi:KDO2-lipid IV(A) lauroyltransferase
VARFTHFETVARRNLERALGAETTASERARIARGVRRHGARLVYEWTRLARGDMLAHLDRFLVFDASIERLERVHARGRGLIVCTAHIGNWELLAAGLRRRGLEGAVVGTRKQHDSSADWLVEMRRAYGVESLPQRSSPRQLLEVLRAGRTLGLLCDLEVRRIAGEFLPFFGMPALTMTAPAALARAAGLPLVPARCVLRGDRYHVLVDEPLRLDRSLERREATRDMMRRVNAVIEGWIRADPEQWAWHQPRWRTRPGEWERAARPLAARGEAAIEAELSGKAS